MISAAWSELGEGLGPLSNPLGRPLARTVKRILEPLVIRPALNPHLGAAVLTDEAAAELRDVLLEAGPLLRHTGAWFVELKKARRAARVTEGSPQELYFPRCYELAHTRGAPGPDAAAVAAEEIADLHDSGGRVSIAELRSHLADPTVKGQLQKAIERTWSAREVTAIDSPAHDLVALLDTCAGARADEGASATDAFDDLVDQGMGTTTGATLLRPGVARGLGLSVHATPQPPGIGTTASKSALPFPFDRSILERIFAALSALSRQAETHSVDTLVRAEVRRAGGAWQLDTEPARVLLLAAREAGRALLPTPDETDLRAAGDAGRRLRARWQREPLVQRALRLPSVHSSTSTPVDDAREAFMRRLWVRLHGREFRGESVDAASAWDHLDGALRSVILDRRDQVKAGLEKAEFDGADTAALDRGTDPERSSTC